MSAEEYEDAEQNGMDYKVWKSSCSVWAVLIYQQRFINVLFCQQKNHLKTKVNQLLRRASTFSSVPEKKHMNGHLPEELKVSYCRTDDDLLKPPSKQTLYISPAALIDTFFVIPNQDGDLNKKSIRKEDSVRRWSEVKRLHSTVYQTS